MGKQKQRKRSTASTPDAQASSEDVGEMAPSTSPESDCMSKKVSHCSHCVPSKLASVTKLKKEATSKLGRCEKCWSVHSQSAIDSCSNTTQTPESVWLCLHCGYQACGANSKAKHFLEHFRAVRSEPAHSVAVNLDNLELWCCSCNADITHALNVVSQAQKCKIDPILAWIRKSMPPLHYSLPTKQAQVTTANAKVQSRPEKNIAADSASQEGHSGLTIDDAKHASVPSFSCAVKGLSNLGNTCFFNSVLQNLAQTHPLLGIYNSEEWRTRLFELHPILNGHRPDLTEELNKLIVTLSGDRGQLTESFINTASQMTTGNGRVFTPNELFSQVCKRAPRFKGFQQQDSHELLRYLLEGLKSDEIKCLGDGMTGALAKFVKSETVEESAQRQIKSYLNSYHETLVDRVFGGKMSSTVMCLSCRNVSTVIEPFLDLSLPIIMSKAPIGDARAQSDAKIVEKLDAKFVPNKSKHQEKKARRETKKKSKKQTKKGASVVSPATGGSQDDIANALSNLSVTPLAPVVSALFDENKTTAAGASGDAESEEDSAEKSRSDTLSSATSTDTLIAANDADSDMDMESESAAASIEEDAFCEALAADSANWRTNCSVGSCLAHFTAAEFLTGRNQFGCEHCGLADEEQLSGDEQSSQKKKRVKYVDAKRRVLISSPPAVLTLHLKRFEQTGFALRKANHKVEFPPLLDIAPYTAKSSKCLSNGTTKLLYSLYGVVEHSGRLNGGHYVAYVKARWPQNSQLVRQLLKQYVPDGDARADQALMSKSEEGSAGSESLAGSWFYVSDSQASPVPLTKVLEAQAYLLFYERCSEL